MRYQGISVAVGAVALLALLSTPAEAQRQEVLVARLQGFQEVPIISTTGTGNFQATISDDESSIAFTLSYSDLEGGAVTQAHIHVGQKDVNGGITIFFCGGAKPACPASPGTVEGTLTAADVLAVDAQGVGAGELDEVIAAMRAGKAYVNVHTATFPGGEVRGQVTPVFIPSPPG
jgi:hypothetical protein